MTAITAEGQITPGINRNRLFWLSCLSLIVTAMTFAIRAGILTQLSDEFAPARPIFAVPPRDGVEWLPAVAPVAASTPAAAPVCSRPRREMFVMFFSPS